jgi:hypothetical protein
VCLDTANKNHERRKKERKKKKKGSFERKITMLSPKYLGECVIPAVSNRHSLMELSPS